MGLNNIFSKKKGENNRSCGGHFFMDEGCLRRRQHASIMDTTIREQKGIDAEKVKT